MHFLQLQNVFNAYNSHFIQNLLIQIVFINFAMSYTVKEIEIDIDSEINIYV